jgi:hypothetical protein
LSGASGQIVRWRFSLDPRVELNSLLPGASKIPRDGNEAIVRRLMRGENPNLVIIDQDTWSVISPARQQSVLRVYEMPG